MNASPAQPFEPATAIASIAVGRSRPGSKPGLAALVVWAVALLAIVAVALLGRFTGSVDSGPRTAVVVFDPPAIPTTAPVQATTPPMPDLIVLASPADAGMTVTTRALQVRGYVEAAADTVRVTLEARGNRIIDDATVRPRLAFGERPEANRHPWFEVEFGLPNPRPNGRMIVQVMAYDREGNLLDVVRRPFRVGVVLDGS